MTRWELHGTDGSVVAAADGVLVDGAIDLPADAIKHDGSPLEYDETPIMEGGEWTLHGLAVFAPHMASMVKRCEDAAARAEAAAARAAATLESVKAGRAPGAPTGDDLIDPHGWENALDDAWPREGGRSEIIRALALEVVRVLREART